MIDEGMFLPFISYVSGDLGYLFGSGYITKNWRAKTYTVDLHDLNRFLFTPSK